MGVRNKALAGILLIVLVLAGCARTGTGISVADKYSSRPLSANQTGSCYFDVDRAGQLPALSWAHKDSKDSDAFYLGSGFYNVFEGVAYVAYESAIAAIDASTGKELWTCELGDFAPEYPTVYRDSIIVVGLTGVKDPRNPGYYRYASELVVVDRKEGKVRWKTGIIGAMGIRCGNEPVVVSDKIYLAALNGEERLAHAYHDADLATKGENRGIYVWDINTGKLLTTIYIDFAEGEINPCFTNLATDGRLLYISADVNASSEKRQSERRVARREASYLVSYDLVSQKVQWKTRLSQGSYAGYGINGIALDDRVVAVAKSEATYKNEVQTGTMCWTRVLDKSNGRLLWKKDSELTVVKSNLALAKGMLFLSTLDSEFICFDSLTGRERWHLSLKGVNEAQAYLARDALYLCNCTYSTEKDLGGTQICALDYDGAALWTWKIPGNAGPVVTSVIPVDKGILLRRAVNPQNEFGPLETQLFTSSGK